MTAPEPYLFHTRRVKFPGPPPRRVSRWTLAHLLTGALFFPGLVVAAGVFMVVSQWHEGSDAFRAVGIVICFGGTLFIGGWFFFAGTLPEFRREVRLLREGQVILGAVTSSKSIVSRGTTQTSGEVGGSEYTQVDVAIGYAFDTPTGARKTGKVARVYTTEPVPPQPQAGDAVAVLYLDDEKFHLL